MAQKKSLGSNLHHVRHVRGESVASMRATASKPAPPPNLLEELPVRSKKGKLPDVPSVSIHKLSADVKRYLELAEQERDIRRNMDVTRSAIVTLAEPARRAESQKRSRMVQSIRLDNALLYSVLRKVKQLPVDAESLLRNAFGERFDDYFTKFHRLDVDSEAILAHEKEDDVQKAIKTLAKIGAIEVKHEFLPTEKFYFDVSTDEEVAKQAAASGVTPVTMLKPV